MRKALIFMILTVFTVLFSAQFEIVKDVYELKGDITAQRYPVKDVNGQWCAILKIYTDIKDLQFKGFGYEKHDYKDGNYLVYMQPNSRNLTFMKDGFTTKPHNFPFNLQSNIVYGMELKGFGGEKKLEDLTVNIIGEPENSIISLDGIEKGKIKSLKTSVGKHELKVTKDNYQTYTKTIEVSADKTMFEYKLEKIKQAEIVINSNPEGAAVYIDGMKLGVTPVPSFFSEGKYKIKLTSDICEDLEDSIEIKFPKTEKTYQMTDIRGSLTINTHEKAKVYINGEQVTDYKDLKLPPQPYTVKVEMNKANPIEEKFILQKKETKTLEMYPQISTGTIQIAVIPTDAEIELTDPEGNKYTSAGSKIFENIPVGNYSLKLSKGGFKSQKMEVNLEEGNIEMKSVKLEEGADVSEDYIFVQGGNFKMGGNEKDEKPKHNVKLDDFYIGKTEVTQAQYESVTGSNPSYYKGSDLPVEQLNWYKAVEFCNLLSEREGLDNCYTIDLKKEDPNNLTEYRDLRYSVICDFKANGYRLPTEAEWEYAARGGKFSKGYKYSGSNGSFGSSLKDYAWYKSNSIGKTQPVGNKKPNELGIYDMSGNVWEMCWDWYAEDYYKNSPENNPAGARSGEFRVMRGGSFFGGEEFCPVSYRHTVNPILSGGSNGFRVVRRAE